MIPVSASPESGHYTDNRIRESQGLNPKPDIGYSDPVPLRFFYVPQENARTVSN
jgi:hypothetical protein